MQRKIRTSILAAVVLALTIASPGMAFAKSNGEGPQAVSQTFFVAASSATPLNTGISLVTGASVSITATGISVWATGDGAGGCSAGSDPNGVGPSSTPDNSCGYVGPTTADGGFLAPGLTAFSLVGKADSGSFFQLGTGPTVVTGQSGTLSLAFNDNYYGDNSKGFTVTVTYTCYPGNGYGDTNHVHCGPPGQ